MEDILHEIMCHSEELEKAFLEIQMPRSIYSIKKFVIGQHDTIEKQYEQCVLEMQIAYDNLRLATLKAKLKRNKIDKIDTTTEDGAIKKEIEMIELEQLNRAILGAARELVTLYQIWKEFPKKYNYEELQNAQENYWEKRLKRQANYDIMALGRISQGSLDALRQAGLYPELQCNLIDDAISEIKKIGQMKEE